MKKVITVVLANTEIFGGGGTFSDLLQTCLCWVNDIIQ